MRILHVTHELPPYELAGTGIYTWNIARAQAQHHDVFIFARLQDHEIEPYRLHTENRDGVVIRFMNLGDLAWSPLEKSYEDPVAVHHLVDFIEEVQPEIVHFQHLVGIGSNAIQAVKDRGLKTVYTLHDFWAMCPMGQRMCYTDHQICDPIDFGKCGNCVFGDNWTHIEPEERGKLEADGQVREEVAHTPSFRSFYRRRHAETPGRFARRPRAILRALGQTARHWMRGEEQGPLPFTSNPFEHRFNTLRERLATVDLLITPSAFLRDEFMTHFRLSSRKVIHSANGMDFSYVKALPKTPSDRIRVGYMGSIIRTKGVHVLVEGFLKAAEEHENLELHVNGAPNRWNVGYLQELEAKAEASPAKDRVHFHGRYDNRKVGELLQKVDVLVVPSIWFENAPLTLNEAAMTGTPIIVSNRGGMLEFARANDYGRTFELGNPDSLAEVLKELAADPSRLAELAGNPPPIKSVAANADELVRTYRELIAQDYTPPSLDEQTRTRGGVLEAS